MAAFLASGVVVPNPGPDQAWVVGALITDPGGRVFVQRRSWDRHLFPGCWDIVGGHVEAGESLLQALEREVREETGWQLCRIVANVKQFTWNDPDGGVRNEVDFLVEVEGDLQHPELEPDKHPEWRWVGPDDLELLSENRSPADTDLLDAITRAMKLAV